MGPMRTAICSPEECLVCIVVRRCVFLTRGPLVIRSTDDRTKHAYRVFCVVAWWRGGVRLRNDASSSFQLQRENCLMHLPPQPAIIISRISLSCNFAIESIDCDLLRLIGDHHSFGSAPSECVCLQHSQPTMLILASCRPAILIPLQADPYDICVELLMVYAVRSSSFFHHRIRYGRTMSGFYLLDRVCSRRNCAVCFRPKFVVERFDACASLHVLCVAPHSHNKA